jgi:hypothetical protein
MCGERVGAERPLGKSGWDHLGIYRGERRRGRGKGGRDICFEEERE